MVLDWMNLNARGFHPMGNEPEIFILEIFEGKIAILEEAIFCHFRGEENYL